MKKPILQLGLIASIFFAFLFVNINTAFAYDEVRDVKGFTKISFSISGDLHLTQGNSFSVNIEGSEKDVPNIITRLEGETLIIKLKKDWKNANDVKVTITLPELKALSIAGSGDVVAKGAFKVDKLNISVAGSGDILFADLKSNKVNVSVAGSGDITIKGKAAEGVVISIAGSGDVMTSECESKNVKVDISGSGTAKVFATDKLNSNIVGSGNVYYKGKPLINANTIGSGSTKPL